MREFNHHITGYIVACQEERFRLMGESGQTLLFTLAKNVPIGLDDLGRWQAAHTHVRVDYTGEPNLVSGIARAVQPLENSEDRIQNTESRRHKAKGSNR